MGKAASQEKNAFQQLLWAWVQDRGEEGMTEALHSCLSGPDKFCRPHIPQAALSNFSFLTSPTFYVITLVHIYLSLNYLTAILAIPF